MYAAEPFMMKPAEEGGLVSPSFTLTNEAAQSLMDSLWDCGIRPTAGQGSAGQLAATERHLADMRTLVFKETK